MSPASTEKEGGYRDEYRREQFRNPLELFKFPGQKMAIPRNLRGQLCLGIQNP